MVWQAYLDESIDDGLLVLAGYLATAESWAAFAREWEETLPLGVLGSNGRYRFKMSEMASLKERMDRVPAFYRIIEKHVAVGVTFAMRMKDFENGKKRVILLDQYGKPVRIHGEMYENIYLFTLTRLLQLFHGHRQDEAFQKLLPAEEKVDFIFDERAEKKSIIGSWDQFLANNPYRDRYGATPRFENDDDFLPLQAADFFAWWTRRWAREERTDFSRPFPWKTKSQLPVIRAIVTEDNVFEDMRDMALRQGKPRRVVDGKELVRLKLPPSGHQSLNFSVSGDGIEFAADDGS